ncbi:hypothetical protein DLJ53_33845 [Acuticoccus sediminis]|uniref:Uncharacterized protein n=1 Tax=Acuticoccus sediminis TaxID=2184697 RepID=A0A8B2NC99_9HYPH|nr:hypothetical protein [Acuticoccus sediminis]RAH95895.1 hypothetical protein DLJ53_33845 [Acuticoccus sediminis]
MFEVGQIVRFRNRLDRPPGSAEVFRITRVLPPVGDALQYRIRNESEPYERVVTEDRLDRVDTAADRKSGSLEEKVFGLG